jgi:hypothetical protein
LHLQPRAIEYRRATSAHWKNSKTRLRSAQRRARAVYHAQLPGRRVPYSDGFRTRSQPVSRPRRYDSIERHRLRSLGPPGARLSWRSHWAMRLTTRQANPGPPEG